MRKQFWRVKQLADQTFARAEKSDVLTEDLTTAEKHVDHIRLICLSLTKRIQGCLQGHGTDDGSKEKRKKKVPESILGNGMKECAEIYDTNSVLSEILNKCALLETFVGNEIVETESKIEHDILSFLQHIDTDIANISKQRRNLNKLILDMDSARTRYQTALKTPVNNPGSTSKADSIKDELEDASQKVEMCRDMMAADMYQLISREGKLADLVLKFVKLQRDHHKAVYKTLDSKCADLEAVIKNDPNQPVYGTSLSDHLRVTERTVAYPIELCVCALLDIGMEEEGLFRVAGGTSKVRKLKMAFDTGRVDLSSILEYGLYRDPHVVAGALKSYLRELPEPILTTKLYEQWMAAARVSDPQSRLTALNQVVKCLPPQHQDNLRYLMKFLHLLTTRQDINKMGSHNIAIVMGPNLIWKAGEDSEGVGGMNISMAGLHSSIVDTLVKNAPFFFPGDLDFYVTCLKPTPEFSPVFLPSNVHNGLPFSSSPLSTTNTTQGSTPNNSGNTGGERVKRLSSEDDKSSSEEGMKRAQSNSSLSDHASPPLESPKPNMRRKPKAPKAPGTPSQPDFKPRPDKPPRLDNLSSRTENTARIDGTSSLPRHFSAQTPTKNIESVSPFIIPTPVSNVEQKQETSNPPLIGFEKVAKELETTTGIKPPLNVKPLRPTVLPTVDQTPFTRVNSTKKLHQTDTPNKADSDNNNKATMKPPLDSKPVVAAKKPIPAVRGSLVAEKKPIEGQKERQVLPSSEEDKPKPMIPARPMSLRGGSTREAKSDSETLTDISKNDNTPTLQHAHMYTVDKQTVSIVDVTEGEQLGHRRIQSLGNLVSDSKSVDNTNATSCPVQPSQRKGTSREELNEDIIVLRSPAFNPPLSPVSRPQRPSYPPPVPPVKPRTGSASDSTDL